MCSFSGLVPVPQAVRPSVHALYQEPPLYYLDGGSLTLAPIIRGKSGYVLISRSQTYFGLEAELRLIRGKSGYVLISERERIST